MPGTDDARTESAPAADDPKWRYPRLATTDEPSLHAEHGSNGASWRGWILGLSAVALLAMITPQVEYVFGDILITINFLPTTCIVALLLLVAVNLLLQRWRARLGLSGRDLTLVAVMTMAASALPGYGFVSWVIGVMTNGSFFARPENDWGNLIVPHQPAWLVPHDPAAAGPRPVEWLMSGLPPGEKIPWSAWAVPYGAWALMALFVLGMMFCLCSILWRQWRERERLPFPLAQVPQALIEGTETSTERRPFLTNRMAWIGMLIAFLMLSGKHMQAFFPDWPAFPLRFSSSPYLTEQPLRALNPLFMNFAPAMVGLTFLLPTHVSFSLWFFYLVIQKTAVFLGVQAGLGHAGWDFYQTGGHRGFIIDQGSGAFCAFVLFGLWAARRHLAGVLRSALRPERSEDTDLDPLPPRAALCVFACCFVGAVIWLAVAGVTVIAAIGALMVLLLVMVGITRISCEGGLFDVQSRVAPSDALAMAFTPVGLGPQSLVVLGMWSRAFAFDWGRTSPMPGMMNGLYLSGEMRLSRRHVAWSVGCAIIISLIIGFVSTLHTVYHAPGGVLGLKRGWGLLNASETDYARVAATNRKIEVYEAARAEAGERITTTDLPGASAAERDSLRFLWIGIGATITLVMCIGRAFLFWIPHPIGYVMWMHPRTMQEYWFPIFLGWLLKSAVLKYGGLRIYQSVKYLFIGLVVGEAATGVVWLLINKLAGSY